MEIKFKLHEDVVLNVGIVEDMMQAVENITGVKVASIVTSSTKDTADKSDLELLRVPLCKIGTLRTEFNTMLQPSTNWGRDTLKHAFDDLLFKLVADNLLQ